MTLKITLFFSFVLTMNLFGLDVTTHQEEAKEWVEKQKADWDFLWFNDDFALLNEYQVKTFPRYLIIDKESNLFQYFPPSPRENLITYLSIIEKQEKAKAEGNTDGAVDIFKKN